MQEYLCVAKRSVEKNVYKIYRITGTKRPMSMIHKNEHNPHNSLSLSALYQLTAEKGQKKIVVYRWNRLTCHKSVIFMKHVSTDSMKCEMWMNKKNESFIKIAFQQE